ncbi:hypothetical protein ZHAS_00007003 [Anopheles sinensis]|uniref:Uncharacterized protein n=1 Tax=Anopheles sinensis TaxID=74873 RepID=A0A084VNG2_ANOSI|nr:hypothetical protein ZHAS_00007003 [Anopheles sinensis]
MEDPLPARREGKGGQGQEKQIGGHSGAIETETTDDDLPHLYQLLSATDTVCFHKRQAPLALV